MQRKNFLFLKCNFKFLILTLIFPSFVLAQTRSFGELSIDDLLENGSRQPNIIVSPNPEAPVVGGGSVKTPIKPVIPPVNNSNTLGAEFQCPMFSTSPLNDIQNAITSIQTSVGAGNAECAKEVGVPIRQKSELIYKLVEEIQAEKGIWGEDSEKTSPIANEVYEKRINDLNEKMKKIITSTEEIYNLVQNNILTNSECAEQMTQLERVVFGVNDLIQGLAPVALKVVGANPSAAPAIPYVFGASLVSSGITALTSMANSTKKLDLTKEVNRRALVQNVCNFIRMYRSVNYLQLAKERRVEELNSDFIKDSKLYFNNMNLISPQLRATLNAQQSLAKNLSPINQRLLSSKEYLDSIDLQMEKNKSDLVVCTIGHSMLKNYKKQNGFPFHVLEDFRRLSQMSSSVSITIEMQIDVFQSVQTDIMQSLEQLGLSNSNNYKQCAGLATTWINELKKATEVSQGIVKVIRSQSDKAAKSNSEYANYVAEKEKMHAHELNKARLQKILDDMEANPSMARSIERTEISRKRDSVIEALFSLDRYNTDQPVKRWLVFQENSFKDKKNEFLKQFEILRTRQIDLAPQLSHPITTVAVQKRAQDLKQLKFINYDSIVSGSEAHKLICRDIEIAYTRFTEAVDSLASIQYMCDMIKPVLYESKVEESLRAYCMDTINYKSKTKSIARYKQSILQLVKYKEQASLLRQKLKELQCQNLSVL